MKEQHPVSKHPDGQAANISHGDGMHHHGVHPSAVRAFNRAEEPVEMHHHLPEKSGEEIMSDAQREHAQRNEHHGRRH
jgi:hypothetical protein